MNSTLSQSLYGHVEALRRLEYNHHEALIMAQSLIRILEGYLPETSESYQKLLDRIRDYDYADAADHRGRRELGNRHQDEL